MASSLGGVVGLGLGGRAIGAGGIGASRGFRVYGIPEAIAKLRGVDGVVRLELGLMLKGAADHMAALAQEFVPVETGNLKEGIAAHRIGPYTWDVTASSLAGGVQGKNNYEYAPFVEFGTSAMEGRFFMTRAYQETLPLVQAELTLIAARIATL